MSATIDSSNVATLAPVWTARFGGDSGFAAGAVVGNGMVYVQDLASNVTALDLASGRVRWRYAAGNGTIGPNGLALADGRVFGMTSNEAFALDALTGARVWANDRLSSPATGAFDTQPVVADGRVYVCTAGAGASQGGVAYALDESTGRTLWRFDTMTRISAGVRKGGMGAGGCWAAASVTPDGSVMFGIGNPYQSARSAIKDPSPQLYSDSVVRLDGATGKLEWYYQAVPNDFYDFDLHLSPIYARADGREIAVASGKMGIVYALDARTGALLWKQPVGRHNGHDDDGERAIEGTLNLPTTPYTVYPGSLGGVTTAMALADGTVYVPVLNLPSSIDGLDQVRNSNDPDSGTGVLVALDLATGDVRWQTELPAIPLGAATVTQDLVLTTLYDGTLLALDRSTGRIVGRVKLPGGNTDAPLTVVGDTVIAATGKIVALRVNGR